LCRQCGVVRANRIAGDDNEVLLISLAVRPLARPPFPLDRLARVFPAGLKSAEEEEGPLKDGKE